MKIEIFDPPMCCTSGLCGPAIDPALMKMADAILALRKQGVTVERHDLRSEYKIFKNNTLVMSLIQKTGSKILPITVIEGKVFKTGEYPAYEELCKEIDIEPLKSHKPRTLQVG